MGAVPSTTVRPELEEIYQAELSRLARLLVDLRARRIWWMALPLGLVVAVDATPLRAGLALAVLGYAVLISRGERRRFDREGFSQRFLTHNAMLMAVVHLVLYLLTGGLASPLLPLLLVFTFSVALLLGDHPAARPFLPFQVGVIGVLATVQLTGLAPRFAPAGLAVDLSVGHAAMVAGMLAILVNGATRVGRRMRGFFDEVVARVAASRQDLLDAHRAQAEELTALSGAIAHELKNPLASVKGLAGLLARDLPEGKPAERLAVLRREVDRMQGILEEFLNFSRPAVPLAREEVELRAVADDVLALHEGLARERGARLAVSGAARVQADPRKTAQILINVLQNALDATPSGGTVQVEVGSDGRAARVRVDDPGPGLHPDVRERLFEAGVTTKPRGSGLGLTIARALARQQGGELTLADRPGGGCRAELTLPIGPAA